MKHGMDFGMERILEQNEITVVNSENHFHPLCCGGHFAIYWSANLGRKPIIAPFVDLFKLRP